MKYELEELENLISNSIKPRNVIKQKNRPVFIQKCSTGICAETNRIRKQFLEEICNAENESRIRTYIQQHQQVIIHLLNELNTFLSPKNTESVFNYPELKGLIKKYRSFLSEVEGILYYLQDRYPAYISKRASIPNAWKERHQASIIQQVSKIKGWMIEAEIETELSDFLFEPFHNFMKPAAQPSFNDEDYLTTYLDQMNQLIEKEPATTEKVTDFLLRMNVNHQDFYLYYINKIKQADQSTGLIGSTEYYYFKLKQVHQQTYYSAQAFQPDRPSIHDQVSTWLAEEIYFLEKKQALSYSFSPSRTDAPNPANNSNKVFTKLSVAHLSLAVKLLLETGIIKNKNASELMRMVAASFRTEKSEHISEDSLRNKSYNIETSAVEGMKDVIIGLLNAVRKY